ncbi:uncharacterized protein LOC107226383 isoform X1 [Neodiprion lecontei]|uniref:Non-homologous end-joining factor 1 n=2 Tax=Neodiprion lecontei TaxID=441921 RepID=A0ABM3FVB4_NEOLC|nr:uncharacterized protein LOC107226383 isoform X1 [Neodiprion lecontei]XP_046591957.1 uncharacterized protein LOC107226383 isoform X1 [Neodiprion lecontei]XP_046591958.1 uncharacterized protein LOC107226383 isoform X1 [Neodiprion lecontei]
MGNKWKDIKINNAEYILSVSHSKDVWKILLSNLVEVWMETITKDVALLRCQSLNSMLDVDEFNIEETFDVILNDIPKYAVDISVDEIKLVTCIDGGEFKFDIKLTKGSPHQFWNEITKPLCQSVMELQRKHEIVLDLIKRKDEALIEYKLSGAQLIRKNIETPPYSVDIFVNKISVHNTQSNECLNAFKSMMDVHNELEKRDSSLNDSHNSLQQEPSSPNPVQPNIKTEVENIEVSEENAAEPRPSSSRDNLRIKKNEQKRSITNGIGHISLASFKKTKQKISNC